MPTKFRMFAIAAALAAGTSTTAMAQYACPYGYTYYNGVCQPATAPAPAPAYGNPVTGTFSGESAGAANGAAAGGPVGAVVGGALGAAGGAVQGTANMLTGGMSTASLRPPGRSLSPWPLAYRPHTRWRGKGRGLLKPKGRLS
jgi:hypothetical protein